VEILNWILAAVAVITSLGGSAFYLRYTATKANLDGKDETINTLDRQLEAVRTERDSLLVENSSLKTTNSALQGIATQTPAIIELTESVTKLTSSFAHHQEQNNRVLKELVTAIHKKGTTA